MPDRSRIFWGGFGILGRSAGFLAFPFFDCPVCSHFFLCLVPLELKGGRHLSRERVGSGRSVCGSMFGPLHLGRGGACVCGLVSGVLSGRCVVADDGNGRRHVMGGGEGW